MCDRERAVGVTLAAPVGLQPRTRTIVSTESHGTQHLVHMIFISLAMMFKRSVHAITRSAEGGREGAYSSAAGSYGSYALAAMATTHLSIADEGGGGPRGYISCAYCTEFDSLHCADTCVQCRK